MPIAVPSVTVSLAEPAVIDSTFEIVTVLLKSPRVSSSLPPPRSMEPLAITVASVILSTPPTPMIVSTLEIVPVFADVGEREACPSPHRD